MNTITEQKNWRVSKARDMTLGEPYIRCRYGVVRQYDDGEIDVWVTNVRVFLRLEKIWKAKKHYDDGGLFIRPWGDLNQVCLVLKARKRRKVSAGMREAGKRLAEASKAARTVLADSRASE